MNLNQEHLFDDYFDTINLNDELKSFYQIINDSKLNESFVEDIELTNLRNENYKRYNNLNLIKLEGLYGNFGFLINEIKKAYEFIMPTDLLKRNIKEALEDKKILDFIYDYIEQLDSLVERELNILEKNNDERQRSIKKTDYSHLDKKTLEKVLDKYNDIILYNSIIEDNVYDNYKRQLQRKKYIDELLKMINLDLNDFTSHLNELDTINKKITIKINEIYDKIFYLEDLMMETSKYEKEFLVFKNYFVNLIAYDDTDYKAAYKVYNCLYKDLELKSLIYYFEDSFIKEIEQDKKEEKFIYEKSGIKNIKNSLNYISANYMDSLDDKSKKTIGQLYDEINNDNYDIDKIYKEFSNVANNIWNETITDVYSYNDNDEFCFICTNNQFIDEKHECILITTKMLERVTDYSNYQIGFICEFNNNIMYITENDDIMSVKYNDMSNLKTPKQIEQEFLNFKICNRLALNGYVTRISAVYFINDGDFIKYKKAIELANQYSLPLIILKKDKF